MLRGMRSWVCRYLIRTLKPSSGQPELLDGAARLWKRPEHDVPELLILCDATSRKRGKALLLFARNSSNALPSPALASVSERLGECPGECRNSCILSVKGSAITGKTGNGAPSFWDQNSSIKYFVDQSMENVPNHMLKLLTL